MFCEADDRLTCVLLLFGHDVGAACVRWIRQVLGSFAVSEEAARMAVEAGWCDELNAEDAPAIPVQGATRWISDMSDHGAIISVCTSDSRKNAEQGLQVRT